MKVQACSKTNALQSLALHQLTPNDQILLLLYFHRTINGLRCILSLVSYLCYFTRELHHIWTFKIVARVRKNKSKFPKSKESKQILCGLCGNKRSVKEKLLLLFLWIFFPGVFCLFLVLLRFSRSHLKNRNYQKN